MINKNKLFDLIGLSNVKEPESDSQESEYNIDFLKIKMFTKLVENRKEFKKNINKNNLEITDELINDIIFNRAFDYLESVHIDKLNDIAELDDLDKKRFIKTIQQSIKYFEQLEKYEKCATLFKVEKEISSVK